MPPPPADHATPRAIACPRCSRLFYHCYSQPHRRICFQGLKHCRMLYSYSAVPATASLAPSAPAVTESLAAAMIEPPTTTPPPPPVPLSASRPLPVIAGPTTVSLV